MILKNYEIKKINIKIKKFILFYGENSGLKKFEIDKLILQDVEREILKYYEKDVLNNLDFFYENILSQSFFNKGKIIIIKKSTDKILDTIKKLLEKNIQDLTIILDSDESSELSNDKYNYIKARQVLTGESTKLIDLTQPNN